MTGAQTYKGHRLVNHGYYQPDHAVWWEAVDADGNGNHHAHTRRELKQLIDEYEKHEAALTAKKEGE